jgi:hypothetical protein
LATLLALCNFSALPSLTSRPSAAPSLLPYALVHDTNASAGSPSAAVAGAIQSVILRGNQEEEQAFAYNDPLAMADTSTPSYYRQMVQSYYQMVNSGVAGVHLDNLTWGNITLQDAGTAVANTTETWTTSFYDGSTQQETDANVYTLVLQGGSWLVQDDQHPNTSPSQPQPSNPGGAPAPTNPTTPTTPSAPTAPGAQQSSNWAGYTAAGSTFTSVSGSWTVPTVNAGSLYNVSADATWVGIGGVNTTDLIQAGTQAIVQGDQVQYSAWWETLPQSSRTVSLNVSPGDRMSVSIVEQADSTWQITILDNTTGQSFRQNVSYNSSLSSAEWIEEAPSTGRSMLIPLDDFGTVSFTNATTVENGRQLTVQQAGGQPITMYSSAGQGRYGRGIGYGGQPLAEPSVLGADGASFSVTRDNTAATGYLP